VLNVHLNPDPLPFCADPDQNQNVKLYLILHENKKHTDIISKKKIKQLFTTRFRVLIKNVIIFSRYSIIRQKFFFYFEAFQNISLLSCFQFSDVQGNVLY